VHAAARLAAAAELPTKPTRSNLNAASAARAEMRRERERESQRFRWYERWSRWKARAPEDARASVAIEYL
tara:strand:- start:23 stop:232 length:210 start_codon:yes stop_codon:yes gene_type:complete